MTEIGPHTIYSDPRIYDEIRHCNWGPLQRPLLLGAHSWDEATWGFKSPDSIANIRSFLRERGCTISIDGAVATIEIDHPPPDNLTIRYVEEHGFGALPVIVLACTPYEVEARRGVQHPHHGIPVFRATVWGEVESMQRERFDHGLIRDVFLVGRLDVREVELVYGRFDGDRLGSVEVEGRIVRGASGHVRRTPQRAFNICAVIAKAIPAWEAFLIRREKGEREAAAAAREAESEAVVDEAAEDEGLMSLSLDDL